MRTFIEAVEFISTQVAARDYVSRLYGWLHQPQIDFNTIDLIAHIYDRPVDNVRALCEAESRATYDRLMAANYGKRD